MSKSYSVFLDIPEDLFYKPQNQYSEKQKEFARTLHLYSPKAYEFVRGVLPLPDPRSLRRYDLVIIVRCSGVCQTFQSGCCAKLFNKTPQVRT